MFLFRKNLGNEGVFETKAKLFQFLKRVFVCFFKKNARNKSFFRVARMGHHTGER